MKNPISCNGIANFGSDIQMQFDKKLYFDVGLLSNNNWIKATTEDGQPNGLMYLVQNLSNLEPNHLLVHLFLMGILLLYQQI